MATTAKIGDVRVTAIVDVTPPAFPVENVFSDVPPSEWDAHQDALVRDFQIAQPKLVHSPQPGVVNPRSIEKV